MPSRKKSGYSTQAMVRHIKSLQVFDSVVAFGNVTRAASQLGISQSSVSYHIRKLEQDLSVDLFERCSTGLELTPHGALLAGHVRKGLMEFENGVAKLAGSKRGNEVRISVVPMFASRRLAPSLGDFWERYPDIQISFSEVGTLSSTLSVLGRELDFAIRWGRDGFEGCRATRIFHDDLVVVCSPDFLKRYPIKEASDVDHCPLLHVDDHSMWAEWFASVRGAEVRGESQMVLEDRSFQLGSTRNGIGLSLFVKSFVQEDLATGRLVNPLKRSFSTSFAYYWLGPEKTSRSKAAQTFERWFFEKIA